MALEGEGVLAGTGLEGGRKDKTIRNGKQENICKE
jgi:hypothetical protein